VFLVVGIIKQFLNTENKKLHVAMEDIASSHTLMEGKTIPNTTSKKKMLLGNPLLLTSQYI
jgi:hypothetical protein